VATFPGEWQDNLPNQGAFWFPFPKPNRELVTLNRLVFQSDVDQNTRRRWLPFSNTLVLPGLNIYEGLGIDDPDKTKWHDVFRVSGRDLKGAIFDYAIMPRVDFTRAQLQSASLTLAELQSVSLDGAQLQGVKLGGARLQGASMGSANLQAASLDGAQLQGANLDYADLRGATLDGAHLQGSSLEGAQLQGASLVDAQLQGAWLNFGQLQGTRLLGAKFAATSLYGAQLQGASLQEASIIATQLSKAFLWRTNTNSQVTRPGQGQPVVVSLEDVKWGPVWSAHGPDTLPWDEEAYQALKRVTEPLAPPPSDWDNEMLRVSRLDCTSADGTLASCDPSTNVPAEAKDWENKLEKARVNSATFAMAWTQGIKAVLCTGEDNGMFYFAGGRSSRSLDDGSIQNSLFALREMTSPLHNRILPAVPEVRAIADFVRDLVDFIMSEDCLVSASLIDAEKARLLRIKHQALQAAGK
jgi:uncharacterized protein YjbI with pentapeptide repeats